MDELLEHTVLNQHVAASGETLAVHIGGAVRLGVGGVVDERDERCRHFVTEAFREQRSTLDDGFALALKQGGGNANGDSYRPSISVNGRYVAFSSEASDLVGSGGTLLSDIFVFDRKTKKTRRVSIKKGGGHANSNSDDPSISADGRFVAFESESTNLIGNDGNSDRDIFRRGPLR